MKNVLIISTSLRNLSNSELLAKEFYTGAVDGDNNVEFISLKDKTISFCKGCLICQKDNKCIIDDDVTKIIQKVKKADVLVFATPIYFYEVSGQMKTLLDRLNPVYNLDYNFTDIIFIATAADNNTKAFDKAINGLKGFISCFNNVKLSGTICGVNAIEGGDINNNKEVMKEAYEMGKNL